MKRFATCVATAALLSAPLAHAANNDINLTGVAQAAFKAFSEDMSSALSYKAVIPAEPLGITGFDIGLEVTSTKMSNADDWQSAVAGGDSIDTLYVPKLHAHKGLPFDIDVGVLYTSIPSTNIKLVGGELRYAFISGNVAIPAVAVRGTYTKLSGIDNLDFGTKGLELSVSKGFAILTPYAGVGRVWTTSDPSASLPLLTKVEVEQTKYYVGANINFGLMNLALEGDKTGDSSSYAFKLGLRF